VIKAAMRDRRAMTIPVLGDDKSIGDVVSSRLQINPIEKSV
jgi:hypothetical protein